MSRCIPQLSPIVFMVLRTVTKLYGHAYCMVILLDNSRFTSNKTRFRNARRGFQGNLGQNIQRIS